MPRVAGINIVGVAAGTIALWLIGFVWYGLLFSDLWMAAKGYTEADFEGSSPAWMGLGFVISLLTTIGLAIVLRWGEMPDLAGCIKRVVIVWIGFGVTSAMYTLAYSAEHSPALFAVDASHLLVGWLAAGVALSFLR